MYHPSYYSFLMVIKIINQWFLERSSMFNGKIHYFYGHFQ